MIKKMVINFLMGIVLISLGVLLGTWFGKKSVSVPDLDVEKSVSIPDLDVEKYGSCSASLLLYEPLDPYESMDYYLFDDFTPEGDFSQSLPLRIDTKTCTYVLDSYDPPEEEYGYAWIKLGTVKDGAEKWQIFKYEPTSCGGARLRYNAKLQTIKLFESEEVL